MDQVLVAVDGSAHSAEVVEEGIKLARRTGGKILLVFAIHDRSVPEQYRDTHGDALPEHYHEDVFERTTADARDRIGKAGLQCEGVYGLGNPAKFILETARKKGVSYIVIGVHGLHNLNRVRALGSTARAVIESSPVPVVAVPLPSARERTGITGQESRSQWAPRATPADMRVPEQRSYLQASQEN